MKATQSTTLKDLRLQLCSFGNEISEVLGSFDQPKQAENKTNVINGVNTKLPGTPEQRSQIISLLSEKSGLSTKAISAETGIVLPSVIPLMSSMFNAKLVDRYQNPDAKYREYFYRLPPSGISVSL